MKITRDVDFDLIKQMIDKGFTVFETADYFDIPYQTIQYYARTRKLGKFKFYRTAENDEIILKAMESCGGSSTKAAQLTGLYQANISRRYKELMEFKRKKEERFKWLEKLEKDTARDAGKN